MKTVSNSIIPNQELVQEELAKTELEEHLDFLKKTSHRNNNKTRADLGIRAKRNKVKKKQQKLARRLNRK